MLLNNYIHWLSSQKTHFIIFFGLVLLGPSLFTGFFTDDLYHHLILTNQLNFNTGDDISLLGLFSFITSDPDHRSTLIQYGIIDWWRTENYTWQFWRPLSEISHWLDYQIYPDSSFFQHLINLLLFAIVCTLLSYLLTNLKVSENTKVLCIAIFAFDHSHAITVSWIANRSAILALIFCLASTIYLLKDRSVYSIAVSWLFFCLALLSGEIGVSSLSFIFAALIVFHSKEIKSSLLTFSLFFITAIIWFSFYKAHNMGISGVNWNYIDPVEYPFRFLSESLKRFSQAHLSQLTALPTELFTQVLNNALLVLGLSGFSMIFIIKALKIHPHRKPVCFFIIVAFGSLVPVISYTPEGRNLIFSAVGYSGLLSILIGEYLGKVKFWPKAFVVSHLIISPILLTCVSFLPYFLETKDREITQKFEHKKNEAVLYQGNAAPFYYIPRKVVQGDILPACFMKLSSNTKATIRYIDTQTLEVYIPETFLSSEKHERIKDSLRAFTENDIIHTKCAQINMLELDSNLQPKRYTIKVRDDLLLKYLRF